MCLVTIFSKVIGLIFEMGWLKAKLRSLSIKLSNDYINTSKYHL